MSDRTKFDVVGKPRRRVDGRAKVTGQTIFADDVVLPRMLHCKLLRSHVPHALIKNLDTTRALAADGVHLVLTGKDVPIEFGILPVSQDEEALCREKVRFVGDPVAAVIARDEQTATAALELIDVEYEPLTTIASPAEALAVDDPRIHDYGESGNIHKRVSMEFGDTEEALADADEIFDDTFFFEGNTHLAIEQHASVGAVDRDGKLTLWSSTQTPHYVHRALAQVLQLPAAHIRVIACPNGGGFGGKSDIFGHEIVVCKAALMLGRPVKICLDPRRGVLLPPRTPPGADALPHRGQERRQHHRDAVADPDRWRCLRLVRRGQPVLYRGTADRDVPRVPRYRFQGCRVFTNKAPCGPKRGHGTVQPRFGQEVQLDKIAERLNVSTPRNCG